MAIARRREYVHVVDYPPSLTEIENTHGFIRIDATVPTSEEINHVALPPDMRIGRKLATVPFGQEPTAADYHIIDSVGRSKFTISFTPAEVGMDGYLVCYYFNHRGDHGPDSAPLKFRIL